MATRTGATVSLDGPAASAALGPARIAARLSLMLLPLLVSIPALAADAPPIRVAAVTFGASQPTECFSDGFLTLVDRDSHLTVQRTLDRVDLGSQKLFDHPMVVMAGDKAFTLTEPQVDHLAAFLHGGGFLLASATCDSDDFDASFRRELRRVLPGAELSPLPADHPMLEMLYRVDRVITVKPTETPLWAVTIDGRVAMLYSPVGLNDSANMGADCCCCGANEIRNARQINANALVYAVTR